VSEVRIAAESRTEFGKGPARRTRRAGKVPAVLYGHGDKPRHYSLPGHELMLALKHDSNVLLNLQTEDGEQLALPKVVVRDPLKRTLTHIDLVAVTKGETVTVEIPLTVVGTAEAGTLVDLQTPALAVNAEATHIPDHLEVSVEGLAIGSHVEAKDITLPAGVTLAVEPDHVIVQALAAPTAEQLEAEVAEAEAELGVTHEEPTAAAEAPAEEAAAEAPAEAAAEE
jgi:large subunit ribosomal protein L25